MAVLAKSAGLAVVFILWAVYLARIWGEVGAREWHLNLAPLGGALVCWLAYFAMLGLGWTQLVRWLNARPGQPSRLGYLAGLRVWSYTMPARYVPGNIWHFAGRLYLGARHDLGREVILGASLLEQVLTLLCSLMLGVPVLLITFSGAAAAPGSTTAPFPTGFGGGWAFWLIPLATAGLAVIHPATLALALRLVGRLRHRPPVAARLTLRQTVLASGWYLLTSVVAGVAFWLGATGVGGVGLGDLPSLVSVYALAYALGYLSFITPAGLGAREAAIVVLLGGSLGVPIAAGVGLIARLGSAGAELIAIAVLAAMSSYSLRLRPARVSSGEPRSLSRPGASQTGPLNGGGK